MLKLFRSKTFLKEHRKIKFTDKTYLKYMVLVSSLIKEETLPPEAKDHPLKGNLSNYREFHVSGDLLVVYTIEEDTLELLHIGSHSEIFG